MGYREQAASLQRHIMIVPFKERLAQLCHVAADDDICAAILEQAGRFAETELDHLGVALDRKGARLVDNEVQTCAEHKQAWAAFRDAGWLSMAAPEPDGMGLPTHVVTACEELFNRASPAFYMLPTSTRCGASLLSECADEETRALWVPKLLSGEWTATICISEPDAGSDVGRIRCAGNLSADGWKISGEKCWISFGSHDLSARIGHLMLARTSKEPGVRGLSLFLVPSTQDDGTANGVTVRRIEEKLGLHGSPTCVLGFEDSDATLLGEQGCGLQYMFHMMLAMRLACGPQGTGVAVAALDMALSYAEDRKQGGNPKNPPLSISSHADVRRQILTMAATVELTRGLNLTCAQVLDLARLSTDEAERRKFNDLSQFLLPIVKDGAAWGGVNAANQAIQVLGGAGYTTEWPAERLLRDARVFPVFEGTTGIQALDMLHRRLWKDNRAGINVFLTIAEDEAALIADRGQLGIVLEVLDRTANELTAMQTNPRTAEAGAVAWLELCTLAVHGWIATRLVRLSGSDRVGAGICAAAQFFISDMVPRAYLASQRAVIGDDGLAGYRALSATH